MKLMNLLKKKLMLNSKMSKLVIYTDGAYSSSRNQGGVGVVILENDKKILEYSNMYQRTTNNQMELGAVIIALRLIRKEYESIIIYTDSQYVIGCATLGWKRKKNTKLWTEFDNQIERVKQLCQNIEFKHVKGHNGEKWNEYCDKLAVKSSQLIK